MVCYFPNLQMSLISAIDNIPNSQSEASGFDSRLFSEHSQVQYAKQPRCLFGLIYFRGLENKTISWRFKLSGSAILINIIIINNIINTNQKYDICKKMTVNSSATKVLVLSKIHK